MQREKYIDLAKGIGILMVIFCHVILLCKVSDLYPVQRFCYSFHMPLFFFISGYSTGLRKNSNEKPDFLSQLKNTGKNIFLPYLVWSIIYMLIADNITNTERIAATLTTRGIAPIWFLATLGCCRILLHTINRISYKLNGKIKLAVFISTAVLCLAGANLMFIIKDAFSVNAQTIGLTKFYLYIALGRFLLSMPIVITGYLFSRYRLIQKINKPLSFIMGGILVTAVWFVVSYSELNTNVHLFETTDFPLLIVTSLCGSIGILAISYSLPTPAKAICYIGKNSLYFMLLHYIPFTAIALSSDAFGFISDPYLFCICTTLGVLIFCLFGTWLIKNRFFLNK